ncbi:Lrp/AsnC family transcriptional regulator [Jannaschia rubra]|uniref:Leucine-responsive regulatory protein n=1 Tax=Jannaschia rubra TaxID=282197 RepID=A0A0M6XPY8_9RHOB|nr:Lrp/AsnC family transcriptional regulator [Jannaschia rubra]CTQ32221.1 Leucine-responsive regulatory protein [Jannaschia rubra]SFG34699.1 transcriptional regulator, AsnC family [Jannaschia rubra]
MSVSDPTDDKILRILGREGRITNQALAGHVGLSPSATLRRVQAMEASGLIRGYRAIIDPDRAGIGFTAYIAVGLNEHTKRAQGAFERAIAIAPEVRECHNVTGSVEYLLRVEARDLAAYKHFHTEVLGMLPQVARLTTYVVMGSPKDERG